MYLDHSDSYKRRRSADYSGMTSPVCSKRQQSPYHSDFSNSSWAEMETLIIGNVQIYPPTLATKQMFILRYLTPMGEYQEVRAISSWYLFSDVVVLLLFLCPSTLEAYVYDVVSMEKTLFRTTV